MLNTHSFTFIGEKCLKWIIHFRWMFLVNNCIAYHIPSVIKWLLNIFSGILPVTKSHWFTVVFVFFLSSVFFVRSKEMLPFLIFLKMFAKDYQFDSTVKSVTYFCVIWLHSSRLDIWTHLKGLSTSYCHLTFTSSSLLSFWVCKSFSLKEKTKAKYVCSFAFSLSAVSSISSLSNRMI